MWYARISDIPYTHPHHSTFHNFGARSQNPPTSDMSSTKAKVRFGVFLSMAFCTVSFYAMGGFTKKAGHGAFDVDKPDSVQRGMDKEEAIRISRMSKALEQKK